MIALGLVGLVALGIFTLSQDTLKTIQSNQLAATRDQLATEFRQSAGRIRNLRLSLNQPENLQFKNCVCGLNAECKSAQAYTFTLYDDYSEAKTPFKTYFDYSGNPCTNSTASNCTIRVKTEFVSQCQPALPSTDPSPPASCMSSPVEFFAVKFTIEHNSDPSAPGKFKPITGSVYTQVANFAPAGSGVCP